jgi:hypothetical protein
LFLPKEKLTTIPLDGCTIHLSPFTFHLSPFTFHLSPLTSHCSLLTSHFSTLTLSSVLQSMTPRPLFLLLFTGVTALFLGGCASSASSGSRDYTMSVGTAYPNEANLAQERVTKYLARLKPEQKEKIAQNDYLAVEATELSVSEVPGLSSRVTGQTGGLTDRANEMAKFIMIFDAKTGRQVGDEGYIVVDTPSKGSLGVFGGYTAVYIGNGK